MENDIWKIKALPDCVILVGPNNARLWQMKNEKWKMTYGK
jgi:hypothetical protein